MPLGLQVFKGPGQRYAEGISFDTGISKAMFSKPNFDIISKRKVAYAISTIVIAIGIGSIIAQGGLIE